MLFEQSMMSSGLQYAKRLIYFLGSKFRNDPYGNKTKLSTLNIDCQFLILEKFDFDSLLNIVQTSPYFAILGADVFSRKFSNYEIVLKNDLPPKDDADLLGESWDDMILGISFNLADFFDPHFEDDRPRITVSDKTIQVFDFNLSLTVLKYFGRVIRYLKVDYSSMKSNRMKKINVEINKYCSNTLFRLDLKQCIKNTLDGFTRPFINVESVSFGSQLTTTVKDPIPLNRLFPNVKNMRFDAITDLDEKYTDCHFLHLRHIYVNTATNPNDAVQAKVEAKISNLIRKNPQISSVALNILSPYELLHIVNELLPTLNSLTLWSFMTKGRSIHFENVKTFILKPSLYQTPVNITFSNLEELQMNFDVYLQDLWFDFFRYHSNLKRLVIREIKKYSMPVRLDVLLEKFLNLEIMSMPFIPDGNIGFLIAFLNNHKKLMRFDVAVCSYDDKRIFRNNCEDKWIISNKLKGLSFQKKA